MPDTKQVLLEEETIALLDLARTMIRDMAMGWPERELAKPPRDVVDRITAALGDAYDFDRGE